MAEHNTASLFGEATSPTERLENLHDAILARLPDVDRVACALYDAQTNLLKTLIESTRSGEAIAPTCTSLPRVARSRPWRATSRSA